MTIAAVSGQNTGNVSTTNTVSEAFTANVSAGSLVVVLGHFIATTDPGAFVAGDCTKLAGTATIGTIQLDLANNQSLGEGFESIGIWSALVTGGGSLTMQITNGAQTNDATIIHVHEFTGDWDSARFEDSSSSQNAANFDTTAETTNSTSAGGALFIGTLGTFGFTATAITEGGDWTLISEETGAAGGGTADTNAVYRIVTLATTDEITWTLGAGNRGWNAGLVVYKEAASGRIMSSLVNYGGLAGAGGLAGSGGGLAG